MSDLETPVGGLQLVLDHLAVPVRFLRSHGDGVHRVEADVDDDGVVLLDEVLVGGEAHIAVNYLYGGKINALTFSLKLSCRAGPIHDSNSRLRLKITLLDES